MDLHKHDVKDRVGQAAADRNDTDQKHQGKWTEVLSKTNADNLLLNIIFSVLRMQVNEAFNIIKDSFWNCWSISQVVHTGS